MMCGGMKASLFVVPNELFDQMKHYHPFLGVYCLKVQSLRGGAGQKEGRGGGGRSDGIGRLPRDAGTAFPPPACPEPSLADVI